ncbi:MAG: MBOAT family protein [Nitrospinae bacterium]|nr:MBOAT family protein [Nitrospinota bacterium]
MLFHSYVFLLAFLPVTVIVYYLLGRRHKELSLAWLAAASLFFYSWWNPRYLPLLVASIFFNYLAGVNISRNREGNKGAAKRFLYYGIAGNLSLLCYYKYMNFFVQNVNEVFGSSFIANNLILPLGISFYTFTQIAMLVDFYKGTAKEYNFIHCVLFVSYFPHLIAGPIIHHKDVMPQFARAELMPDSREFLQGVVIFFLGLLKKTVFADSLAPYPTSVFAAAGHGGAIGFVDAWAGSVAYSMQLYFDFSGYSDMAIGLSLLFGIKLPVNFNSPYKADSIIDFWRRWHITLSKFFQEYVFYPLIFSKFCRKYLQVPALAGGKKLDLNLEINFIVVMILIGFWHTANWQCILYGVLQGIYLATNNLFHTFFGKNRFNTPLGRTFTTILTFTAVVISLAVFRSESMTGVRMMVSGMADIQGVFQPGGQLTLMTGALLAVSCVIAWFFPNVQEIVGKISERFKETRFSFAAIIYGIIIFYVAVLTALIITQPPNEQARPFLYFDF